MAVAATVSAGIAGAQPIPRTVVSARGRSRASSPLALTRRVDAGPLSVAYAELGPATGSVVVLLHGWPYDIHSFEAAGPLLASRGYRVIIPYLRGYGGTRFLSATTLRNGQPAALAVDVIDLMDALRIRRATLAGFDWGARTAAIVGALWPERCDGLYRSSMAAGWKPASAAPEANMTWPSRATKTCSCSL